MSAAYFVSEALQNDEQKALSKCIFNMFATINSSEKLLVALKAIILQQLFTGTAN